MRLRSIRGVVSALIGTVLAMAVAACGGSPSLVITSPAQGSFHFLNTAGSTVPVEGQLLFADLPSATVRLWWDQVGAPAAAVVAPLDPSGRFAVDLTIPPGDNQVYRLIVAEARYGPGGAQVLRAANGLVTAETPSHRGTGDHETVSLRLNDSGIDKIEPWLSSIASSQIDIGALVGSGDLLNGASPCVVPGPFGSCLLRVNSAQLWNDALGPVHVYLNALTNRVLSNVHAEYLDLVVRVKGKALGINYTCDLSVHAPDVWIDGSYALEPKVSDPSQIGVQQVGNASANVSWTASDLGCAGVLGGMLGDLIQWIVNPNVTQPLENALTTAVNGNGQPIAQAFEAALGGLALGQTVGNALQADLNGLIDRVPEDADGVSVAAGIYPTPVARLCDPGQIHAGSPVLCPTFPATYMVPTALPAGIGAATPTPAPVPYDIALGLSDTAFSALFRTLGEQGHFSGRVAEMEACRTYAPDGEPFDGPGLTYKCLLGNDPFLCTLLGVSCEAPLQILYYPAMPVVSRGGYGLGTTMGDLVMQMNVDVMTDPARHGSAAAPSLVTRITLLLEAAYDLVVDVSGPEPRLGLDTYVCFQDEPGQPCEPNVKITTVSTNFGNPYIGPNLIDLFLLADGGLVKDTLVSALDGAVQTFPLPTVLNKQISPILTKRHGGFNGQLMMFGDLVD